ncbi:hypothetical protein QVD17_21837 [Tagetes erecta]|uniref:Uncharacterized protein n=1 Tax=Tagetes erecta TaxID=13708 RepID=A0AAD8KH89_TARER|nr:hypothetical protein QVD17_21837 [Tagetes erecta]
MVQIFFATFRRNPNDGDTSVPIAIFPTSETVMSPEFPWQEGDTAFATKEETNTEEGETRCHDAFFLTSRKWLKVL